MPCNKCRYSNVLKTMIGPSKMIWQLFISVFSRLLKETKVKSFKDRAHSQYLNKHVSDFYCEWSISRSILANRMLRLVDKMSYYAKSRKPWYSGFDKIRISLPKFSIKIIDVMTHGLIESWLDLLMSAFLGVTANCEISRKFYHAQINLNLF